MIINMDTISLRKKIKNLIREEYQNIHVVNAHEIGIDNYTKFKIELSNGKIDYADPKKISITSSHGVMYQCLSISGILPGESGINYKFTGFECNKYIDIEPKSIQIS